MKTMTVGIKKEKGFLYYVGKDGNVWKTAMKRAGQRRSTRREIVAKTNIQREPGFLYFVDKKGNVGSAHLAQVVVSKAKAHAKRR